MEHEVIILLTLGGILVAGLAMDELGRRTHLPRVTLLVICGMVIGPSAFNLLPPEVEQWYGLTSVMALVMVAFLLGGKLTRQVIAEDGANILGVSAGVVLVTCVVVSGGLYLAGVDPVLCLLLGGIATATDPAATQDVVTRGGYDGRFSRTLLGVVAIDDAWGLIAFSILLSMAHAFAGQGFSEVIEIGARELIGAILIGLVIGVPAAYLTGRLREGEPTQAEALGVVFLCGGISLMFEASYLLATMIAGFVVANLARHHEHAFHEIEHIEWPFIIIFFILAGASLDLSALPEIGAVGGIYIVLRIVSRLIGGWVGGFASGMEPIQRNWCGFALMPQAGVAMGMALVGAVSFPEHADTLLAVAVGSTILFELGGPVLTQMALSRIEGPPSERPRSAESSP